jgi:hypothetical protein
MAKDRDPWQQARRSWGRLNGGHADDGTGALAALADVGLLRRLLDQAELVAVRTARQHNKSWAEIAVRLGVTRQSAWERWRDLDETEPRPVDTAPAEVLDRSARDLRRRATIVVPNVVAMIVGDARQALQVKRLVAIGPDPDGLGLSALDSGDVVTDQSPEAGAKVPIGNPVTIWCGPGRGGSAGVREPHRPKPTPKPGRELHYDSNEARS